MNLKKKNQSPCPYLMLLENFLKLNYEVNQIPLGLSYSNTILMT